MIQLAWRVLSSCWPARTGASRQHQAGQAGGGTHAKQRWGDKAKQRQQQRQPRGLPQQQLQDSKACQKCAGHASARRNTASLSWSQRCERVGLDQLGQMLA